MYWLRYTDANSLRRGAGLLLVAESFFFILLAFTTNPGPLGVVLGTGAGGVGILYRRRWGVPIAYFVSATLVVLYAWVTLAVRASPASIGLALINLAVFALLLLSRRA
jgi:hypothetical protein